MHPDLAAAIVLADTFPVPSPSIGPGLNTHFLCYRCTIGAFYRVQLVLHRCVVYTSCCLPILHLCSCEKQIKCWFCVNTHKHHFQHTAFG